VGCCWGRLLGGCWCWCVWVQEVLEEPLLLPMLLLLLLLLPLLLLLLLLLPPLAATAAAAPPLMLMPMLLLCLRSTWSGCCQVRQHAPSRRGAWCTHAACPTPP
jgi:hypothetical protein